MIAIKDMEMPRSCFCCPYSKKGSILDGGYFCKLQILDGEISTYTKSQYKINGEFKDKQGCPLVETEERKQGEWIRNPSVNGFIDDFRCSCCNSNPPVMSVNISWGWNLTNFCPNCGADMRGRKNEV